MTHKKSKPGECRDFKAKEYSVLRRETLNLLSSANRMSRMGNLRMAIGFRKTELKREESKAVDKTNPWSFGVNKEKKNGVVAGGRLTRPF